MTRRYWMISISALGLWAAPAFAQIPTVPPEFGVSDRVTILIAHGEGTQVYQCKAAASGNAWVFREPVATLIGDGQTIGHHSAGPTWELTDGSRITGKMAANIPGATIRDLPQLKLDVVEHSSEGKLKDATTVLRVNTHGGELKGPCPEAEAYRSVPYSADYIFLR